MANWSRYGMRKDRKMIQPLLNEKSDDSIRIENEISSLGVPVSNHTGYSGFRFWKVMDIKREKCIRQKCYQLRCLWQYMDIIVGYLCRYRSSGLLCLRAVIGTNTMRRSYS